MGEESGEKTEQPTPHKLREARKKGQIAKSKDITGAFLMLASFYALKYMGVFIWEQLYEITYYVITLIPEEFNVNVAGLVFQKSLITFAKCLAPLLAVSVLVAIVFEAAQTGFVVSLDPIKPKLNKINPIEGVKKFFSLKQYVEFLKSFLKMVVVVGILYYAIVDEFYMVLISQELSLWQLMGFTGSIVMKVVLQLGLFYIFIAMLDYAYQRYQYIKGLKMSKKEIKDEYKRLEGDPQIKQKRKEAARQMAQGRQMGNVPGADVVVTNPVFIAIAIKYQPKSMQAPIVVAKGIRLFARQIRQLAEENNIPIVENPPLARRLYRDVEAEDNVPPRYYRAVAEILAFVYNLKKKKQRFY